MGRTLGEPVPRPFLLLIPVQSVGQPTRTGEAGVGALYRLVGSPRSSHRTKGKGAMRRTVGFILLGLAGFLVTAAVLALVWVPGQVKKTPLDANVTTKLTGNATVLPTGAGSAVKAIQRTVADGTASTSDVVVFDNFSCLVQDPDGTTPDCVDDTDPDKRLVTAETDHFATNRVTALAVNDEQYVGVNAVPHEGLVNKFPFDVEQKTYPFWDGVVGRAVEAKYQGAEDIDGLPTYKFNVVLTEEPAEISEGISGTYSDDLTMWIDQGTGSIIDQTDKQVRKLDDGTPVLDLELELHRRDGRRERQDRQGQQLAAVPRGRCPPRARATGPARRGRRCVPRLLLPS